MGHVLNSEQGCVQYFPSWSFLICCKTGIFIDPAQPTQLHFSGPRYFGPTSMESATFGQRRDTDSPTWKALYPLAHLAIGLSK